MSSIRASLDHLKKLSYEAGLEWASENPVLREPKSMTTMQLLSESARAQARKAAEEWATNNVDGFDDAARKARTLKRSWNESIRERTRANKAMHVINEFAKAVLSRCKVLKR